MPEGSQEWHLRQVFGYECDMRIVYWIPWYVTYWSGFLQTVGCDGYSSVCSKVRYAIVWLRLLCKKISWKEEIHHLVWYHEM